MNIKYNIKTLPKDVDISAQIDMYDSLIAEATDNIGRQLAKSYDDFVFSILSQFGINKDNCLEYVGRIVIFDQGLHSTAKHWYIDGEYKFTIIEVPCKFSFNEDGTDFRILTEYKVEVWDELKGRQL